jgi:hypothetical protein
MKRRSMYSGVVILVLSSIAARAEDKLTLQLKWVTQAQFAGWCAGRR